MRFLNSFDLHKVFTLLALTKLSLVSSFSVASAGAVTDVIEICSRWADAPITRSEKFIDLGWTLVTDLNLPLAHANALSNPPEINTQIEWSKILDEQLNLQRHQNWPYVFKLGDAFVFLGRLSQIDPSDVATCVLVGAESQDFADVFSESEALGTLEVNRGIIKARISRAVMEDDLSGWISVIFGFGITEELNLPGQLATSMKLTIVNGPLR